ncbi:nuclear transcription factor Y subunit A-7-like [Corylus avellana]|uniref:nuclear transcription factor Y subunit A-7-like n=1 Tax=Corylus avellana TaxID=13451 RepID=UPI00286B72B4|nr:nuclear transcription factor Y subunit A-7-like [Corylus avellana]XP_059428391.1 nuclear transcription factor Y subunit A-7-like [Corylus avellana]XP_059428392.1 nuclear transcription factor Y subunit A-7-like [Corylus avellana]XP_059428393.1 nuclear transcription factor Y subunit A-7-like [Corylus avellana]
MHQKQDDISHQHTVCSKPWWRGVGHDPISADVLGETTRSLSPSNNSSDSLGTETRKLHVKDGLDEGNDVNKKIEITLVSQSDGKCGKEQQHAASFMPQTMGEYLTPPTQLELLGHSIACTSYQYSDPYYGGVMPAYGPQALAHSHCLGVLPARMALPLEMAEEPVYVNAKQYHGILRRRQSRAKAELEKKLIKLRKPYLHESRHLHAMRRARGSGGRFLNTKKLDSINTNIEPDKGAISPGEPVSTHPFNSLHSELSNFSSFSGSVHSSSGHMEVTGIHVQEMHQPQTYSNANGNGWYRRR